MIPYQQRSVTLSLDVEKMEVYITRSANGVRAMRVTIPIIDDEGRHYEPYVKWAHDAEFNALYDAYSSDKNLLTAILTPEGVDVSSMPDNLMNGGSDGQEQSVADGQSGGGDAPVNP